MKWWNQKSDEKEENQIRHKIFVEPLHNPSVYERKNSKIMSHAFLSKNSKMPVKKLKI